MNDIVINKVQSIQRCIERVREDYLLAGDKFRENYSIQDAVILNIMRACEQAIDLANHIIKSHKMGIPTSSSECFELLAKKNVITETLSKQLIKMVGFRNIAVHQYQELNINIVEIVINSGIDDLVNFTDSMINFIKTDAPDSDYK